MERERLARLLEEPARVAREDLGGLKALAEKYPWFSGAQLLRTVGERASGDVLFDETIRSTSAHLPSRAVLYDLAYAPPTPASVKLHVVKPERTPVLIANESVETEVPSPAVPEELVAAPSVMEVPEDPKVEDAPSLPAGPLMAKESAGTTAVADPLGAEFEEQILRTALAGAYDLTLQEQLQDAVPQMPGPIESAAPPAVSARPVVSPTARLRFSDWLDVAEATTGSAGASTLPAAITPEGKTQEQAPAETTDAADLIERFIQQANPAPPQKPPFFAPQQAGKRSLDDTVGLVTETLARIYVKQGNLPKAIATYGRLALKHPEKGAYFAALQKELEAQLNK